MGMIDGMGRMAPRPGEILAQRAGWDGGNGRRGNHRLRELFPYPFPLLERGALTRDEPSCPSCLLSFAVPLSERQRASQHRHRSGKRAGDRINRMTRMTRMTRAAARSAVPAAWMEEGNRRLGRHRPRGPSPIPDPRRTIRPFPRHPSDRSSDRAATKGLGARGVLRGPFGVRRCRVLRVLPDGAMKW